MHTVNIPLLHCCSSTGGERRMHMLHVVALPPSACRVTWTTWRRVVRTCYWSCAGCIGCISHFHEHPVGLSLQRNSWWFHQFTPASAGSLLHACDQVSSEIPSLHSGSTARCRQQWHERRLDRLRRGHSMQEGSLRPHRSGSPISRPLAPHPPREVGCAHAREGPRPPPSTLRPRPPPLRPRPPQVPPPPAPQPSQSASPVHAHCSLAPCVYHTSRPPRTIHPHTTQK